MKLTQSELLKLSPRVRQVVALRLEGQGAVAIAAAMGITPYAVYTAYHRARRVLHNLPEDTGMSWNAPVLERVRGLLAEGRTTDEIAVIMARRPSMVRSYLRRLNQADTGQVGRWAAIDLEPPERCACGLLNDEDHKAAGCGLGRAENYARSGGPAGGEGMW